MMTNKVKNQVSAWRRAMQQDLDRLTELHISGDFSSEEHNRLETNLDKAVSFVDKKFGVCTSFSRGKNVYMQVVDRRGYLITV